MAEVGRSWWIPPIRYWQMPGASNVTPWQAAGSECRLERCLCCVASTEIAHDQELLTTDCSQPLRDAVVTGAGTLPVLAEAVGAVIAPSSGTRQWCGRLLWSVHAVAVAVAVIVPVARTAFLR